MAEKLVTTESPVSKITPQRLIGALACPAFRRHYDIDHPQHITPIHEELMDNGAFAQVQEDSICDDRGRAHLVRFTRDRNGVLLQVFSSEHPLEVIKLGIRDRGSDGTPAASPPKYLKEIGGVGEKNIPPESYDNGATNWYYSSPAYDTPPPHIRAAEFSISSSDEAALIVKALRQNGDKKDKLFDRNPEQLAAFIEDPFAMIPPPGSKPEEINRWYRYWWQVTNRALRGKSIPYPGQSSQHGFEGYFDHVVDQSVALLKELGYTHLSGVPSYHHVWDLNLRHGFEPENPVLHAQAVEFDQVLKSVPLPQFSSEALHGAQTLGDTLRKEGKPDRTRSPLLSWYALLPYMLMSHPEHQPFININHGVEDQFQEAFAKAASSFSTASGIISYPLAPGQNLWHSKPLT